MSPSQAMAVAVIANFAAWLLLIAVGVHYLT